MIPRKLAKSQQRATCAAGQSHVLLFAGAGTGKTETLTHAIGRVLDSASTMPSQVLAVTFGRKATAEMRERLIRHVGASKASKVSVSTLHALATSIIEQHGALIGLSQTFTIPLKSAELDCLKQVIVKCGYKAKDLKKIAAMHRRIEKYKCRGILPSQITVKNKATKKLAIIYAAFQSTLLKMNLVTYSDQIIHAVTLLRNHEHVRTQYANKYRNIFIDEFQDLNPAQYALLKLLAGQDTLFWTVGDDDQNLYSWRGADTEIMSRFSEDFPMAKVFMMERNRRSMGHVVDGAYGLIQHNQNRHPKKLYTKKPKGEKIKVHRLSDQKEEAEYIAKRIVRLIRKKGVNPQDIAVLARFKQVLKPIQKILTAEGIPCHFSGDTQLLHSKTVTDALAYMHAIENPKYTQAFETIINTPKRGIGHTTIEKIQHYATAHKTSFWKATRRLEKAGKLNKASVFIADFLRWRKLRRAIPVRQAATLILQESGYMASLKGKPDKLAAIEKLVGMTKGYATIRQFLNGIAEDIGDDDATSEKAVHLMTLHAAKGLAFDAVFMPAWEDGVFPNYRALDSNKADKMEEERRLAYVGITRAREYVCITHIVKRRPTHRHAVHEVKPSRFIEELPRTARERTRSKLATKLLRSGSTGEGKSKYIAPGDIVSHNKDCGYGQVVTREGKILVVKFNDIGLKTVRLKEVTKA